MKGEISYSDNGVQAIISYNIENASLSENQFSLFIPPTNLKKIKIGI